MKRKFPPGPRKGIFGLECLGRVRSDLLAHCVGLADRYGDCVYYRLCSVEVYQFSHPDQIREVLVDQPHCFRKPSRCEHVFGDWHGEGMLLNEGEAWMQQRRLVQPALCNGDLDRHAELVVGRAANWIDSWTVGEFDIAGPLARLTFCIVAESLFGVDPAEVADRFVNQTERLQEFSMRGLTAPI